MPVPANRTFRLLRQRAALYLHLVRAARAGRVSPVVADLFLTTRCNARCSYCYTDKTITRADEMDTAQWMGVMSGLVAAGSRMFNVMGGEPLLRDDLPRLLAHAASLDVLCDLNTNCFLLPERKRELVGVSQIFTSLDGRQTAHDLNRGAGSFNRTMAGIEAALSEGIPVRINCTVTRHNVDDVEYLAGLAEEMNLFLTFTPLIRVRDALRQEASALELGDAETREAFAAIKQAKRRSRRIMNSDAALDFLIRYPVPLGTMVMRDATGPEAAYYDAPCPYGRLQHFVVSNGDVFPCHNMWNEPSFRPLNVLRDGLGPALTNASRLPCRFCWLANLVEWNEITSPGWLAKGALMTFKQLLGGGARAKLPPESGR